MSSVAEAPSRYRCTACGNLTRFDITSTVRSRSFHHFTVGGDVEVLNTETLHSTIESVECRWCGTSSSVVVIAAGSDNDGGSSVPVVDPPPEG